MPLDKSELRGLLPHAGAMCLLDAVFEWDETRIVALATSHRLSDNPLRREEGLGAVCGIEYAAQAVAIHGGLLARERGSLVKPGYLAAIRDLELAVDYLDSVESALVIRAEMLIGNETSLLYAFAVESNGSTLLAGRVSVFLTA
ncbi:hydroxymyristoyl-ACP dehydratase [Methylocaldum sp.]|uniref:hydroxymyristoyl-ACP dehydratase n=1 Tax=Methylocaldum sp. TaxID=1969727 RepID=UPI002D612541|nr:hydroxymyristoyl-ACP dehydratase [Methylocaldum sp.]HYE37032.1 hydroxymyristoyl-ACP dehydratase [Methylocaldum sp.]